MKQVKIDLNSFLIGILAMSIVTLTLSFKTSPSPQQNQVPRYQAVAAERGFIIMDTYSGDYILDSEVTYVGKMTWIKGNFQHAFDAGKDKTNR